MELDCPGHFPPLGSPQGCFHFQYSLVSCSEVLCLSHWQIGLTVDAAVSKHKTAIVQKVFTLWNLGFVLCPVPITGAMKFLFKVFLSVNNKSVSGLPIFIRLHQGNHPPQSFWQESMMDNVVICCSTPCFNQCGYSKALLTQQLPLKPAIAP